MKILEIKEMENCFDGSFMKEVVFEQPVNKNFIFYLGVSGNLEYYDTFPRPFYKISIPYLFTIQGVENNNDLKLILTRSNPENSLEMFCKLVNEYKGGNT